MVRLVKDGRLVTNHWNWQFEPVSEVRLSGSYYLTLALMPPGETSPGYATRLCIHCCFDVPIVHWSSIHFISCSEGSSILEYRKHFLFAGGNHTLGSGNPLVACLMSHRRYFSRLWLHPPAHTNGWPCACRWLAIGLSQLHDVTYYQWQTMQVMVIHEMKKVLINKFNTKVIFGIIFKHLGQIMIAIKVV